MYINWYNEILFRLRINTKKYRKIVHGKVLNIKFSFRFKFFLYKTNKIKIHTENEFNPFSTKTCRNLFY